MTAHRLDLDFGRVSARLPGPGVLLLVAGVVAAALGASRLAGNYDEWRQGSEEYRAASSRLHALGNSAQRGVRPSAADLREAQDAAEIAARLRTPWEPLLQLLETTPVSHVALLAVEPVPSTRQLRITAEARDLPTMLDYLAFLQHQPHLHAASLVGHQIQQRVAGNPVRFQVQAKWGAQ